MRGNHTKQKKGEWKVGTPFISFLVLGPEYIQRLLSTSFRGQFYVQEKLTEGRQSVNREFGGAQPAKDYTSRLGEFDIVVVVTNHFPDHEVEQIKSRANGKTILYDETARGVGLKALIEEQLRLHPIKPAPAEPEV